MGLCLKSKTCKGTSRPSQAESQMEENLPEREQPAEISRAGKFLQLFPKVFQFLPKKVQASSLKVKIPILSAATALLSIKSWQYISHHLMPYIHQFQEGRLYENGKVLTILFIDLFFCVAGAMVTLFFLAQIFGRPGKPGKLLLFFRQRPIVTFAVFMPVLFFISVGAPKVIADFFLEMNSHPSPFDNPFGVHPLYYQEALMAAFCVALSIADLAVKPNVTRYWSYLFLLPVFNSFPLLWWNAFAWILPSRYWKIWRPVLAGLTCMIPLVVFPFSTPIREDIHFEATMPMIPGAQKQALDCIDAYQVIKSPVGDDIYLRCGLDTALQHFHRNSDGKWEFAQKFRTGYLWNRGAYDFEKNRAYIINQYHFNIDVIDLDKFEIEASIPLVPYQFPFLSDRYYLDLDSKNKHLIVCDSRGFIAGFDTDTWEVKFYSRILKKPASRVWSFAISQDEKYIFVGTLNGLVVVKASDLAVVKRLEFKYNFYDILPDPKRKRILLSFPEQATVLALDDETFDFKSTFTAPMGVRNMIIDSENNLLILTAFTGVVEVVDIDQMTSKNRARLNPWIHGITVLPDYCEAVVTSFALSPQVWQYYPINRQFRPFDEALSVLEKVYRIYLEASGNVVTAESIKNIPIEPDKERSETYFIYAASSYYDRSIEDEGVKMDKYKLIVVSDMNQIKTKLENDDDCIDQVYFDFTDSKYDALKTQIWDVIEQNSTLCAHTNQ